MVNGLKMGRNALVALLPPIIVFFVLMLLAPNRIGLNNLSLAIFQAIPSSILAIGVTFSFKSGNWDLAIGAEALVASVIGGNIAIILNLGLPGMIISCVSMGLLSGVATGLVYKLLKVPSIIVTLGMMLLLESMTVIFFEGKGVIVPSQWVVLGTFPYNVIIGIASMAIAYYILFHRKIGFHINAVGDNINMAKASGLDVYKIKLASFAFAGLFAGIYAFFTLGITGVAKPPSSSMSSLGIAFDAMMGMFLGTALSKRVNLIIGIYIGGIVMQLIKMGLLVLNVPSAYQSVFIAALVVIFMSATSRPDLFSLRKLIKPKDQIKIKT